MHQIIPVRHVRAPSGMPSPECLTPCAALQADSRPNRDPSHSEQILRFDILLKVNVEAVLENGRPTIRSFRSLTLDDVLGGLLPLTGLSGDDEGFLPLSRQSSRVAARSDGR